MSSQEPEPSMIRVGQVTAAFGTDGAVKVLSLTDFDDRFDPGARLHLDGEARKVEWSRVRPSALIVKLAGIDNRTLADLHRGHYLEVPRSEARSLAEGSFYQHQLIGLEVVTESGQVVGRLTSILQRPANDVWVASSGDGTEHLVPATRDAVKQVDLSAGKVVVAGWLLEEEPA
jgi:16S rRNA processing protein RimM